MATTVSSQREALLPSIHFFHGRLPFPNLATARAARPRERLHPLRRKTVCCTGNPFICKGTTGRWDGFGAVGSHPVSGSNGTVTRVFRTEHRFCHAGDPLMFLQVVTGDVHTASAQLRRSFSAGLATDSRPLTAREIGIRPVPTTLVASGVTPATLFATKTGLSLARRVVLAHEVWDNTEKKLEVQGEGYQVLRRSFDIAFRQAGYSLSPDLLNKLASPRFSDWTDIDSMRTRFDPSTKWFSSCKIWTGSMIPSSSTAFSTRKSKSPRRATR